VTTSEAHGVLLVWVWRCRVSPRRVRWLEEKLGLDT
jgi:hypothetical protein